jgi:hypothetical protein
MKKIWRENPNMKDIHGKFLPNSPDRRESSETEGLAR